MLDSFEAEIFSVLFADWLHFCENSPKIETISWVQLLNRDFAIVSHHLIRSDFALLSSARWLIFTMDAT
jgi:hypothetical protein